MAMFCTNLRKRADLKGLATQLATSTNIKIKGKRPFPTSPSPSNETRVESKLESHDLAFPLGSQPPIQSRTLRLLLLSSATLEPQSKPSTISRIERLSSLTGGDCVAITFLLSTTEDDVMVSIAGKYAYAELQVL
ncbi:MAG: hypothetical protein Q9187_006563, partial [Circinaria calcarea]